MTMKNLSSTLKLHAGLVLAGIYCYSTIQTPLSYNSMSSDLKLLACDSSRGASEEDIKNALGLAEKFDFTAKYLSTGYPPKEFIPFLDVFSGDFFRYVSEIGKLTPHSPSLIPIGR